MKVRLAKVWDTLRTSYWFVPSLMALGALVLALAMVHLDTAGRYGWTERLPWLYSGGPDGARAVLATIAGSMITVAGVAFSITIVALSLASQQFGPRLLYSFMRDRGNQVVLGTFISTFVYCLLVLRTIFGSGEQDSFVPHASTTVGVALATLSLGVLIFFIHHVSISIQAPHVVASVADDLHAAIEDLLPNSDGREPDEATIRRIEAEFPADFRERARAVEAHHNGYVQGIDEEGLIELATAHDLVVHLEIRPGHFALRGSVLAYAGPAERVRDEVVDAVRRAMVLGSQRTAIQDLEFSVDQLVEVAIRALSPGINDPFTAANCVDHLAAGLAHLLRRGLPARYRLDAEGRLRLVIARPLTFAGIADSAFHQIRQYGAGSAAVTIRMLERIASLVPHARHPGDLEVLRHHAILVQRAALESLREEWDRQDVQKRFDAVAQALEEAALRGGGPPA